MDRPNASARGQIETAAETDRRREFEVLNAYSQAVPAPKAVWLDEHGTRLGQPFPTELREKLAPQYIRILADLHNVDWSTLNLPSFAAPQPGSGSSTPASVRTSLTACR